MPIVRPQLNAEHSIGRLVSERLSSRLYLSVKTGNEAQISIDRNSQPDYREKLNAELEEMRNKEIWRAGVTVRKLRPENN